MAVSVNEIQEIPWNFAKFLLDKDGKVVKFFPPKDHPMDLCGDIDNLLRDE